MNKSEKMTLRVIPGIGSITEFSGMKSKTICSDNYFEVKKNDVISITATGDGKVEFIAFPDRTLAYIKSAMDYPAYYPVQAVSLKRPIKYVLMDLDGTTVLSEKFWIWIIQLAIASLLEDQNFSLEGEDMPYVSGHSVSEHLQYCINKYCQGHNLEKAREYYFQHTQRELEAILEGHGKTDAFRATPGLKEFLLKLKKLGIKIGLVTSGLYEKAWPEIKSVFDTLDLGPAEEFYDAIITAGHQPGNTNCGTLGELEAKPHPWLYAEAATIGLKVKKNERNRVIGIEDSGAGICSVLLAGYTAVGIGGGNIEESGTKELCSFYGEKFDDIYQFIIEDK